MERRVYLGGVILLGLAYWYVERVTGGGWLFVCTALGYLVVVRLVGLWFARRWARNHPGPDLDPRGPD
jgi:thiol:disulfide interchange protein